MTKGDDPAMPVVIPGFAYSDDSYEPPSANSGLTKREFFAAMAQVPQVLFENEINEWKGDNNKVPQQNYGMMLNNLAKIEAIYKARVADLLLRELNDAQ